MARSEIAVTPPDHVKALYLAAAAFVHEEGGTVEKITGTQIIRREGGEKGVFFLGVECHGKVPIEPEDDEPTTNN